MMSNGEFTQKLDLYLNIFKLNNVSNKCVFSTYTRGRYNFCFSAETIKQVYNNDVFLVNSISDFKVVLSVFLNTYFPSCTLSSFFLYCKNLCLTFSRLINITDVKLRKGLQFLVKLSELFSKADVATAENAACFTEPKANTLAFTAPDGSCFFGQVWGKVVSSIINWGRPSSYLLFISVIIGFGCVSLSDQDLRAVLKSIEGVARVSGFNGWEDLVGAEGCGGYMDVTSAENKEKFDEDVEDWVFNRRLHKLDGSEEKFMDYFRSALDYTFLKCWNGKPFVFQKLEDTVRDGTNWSSDGVSLSRVEVRDTFGTKMLKSKMSKKNESIFSDTAAILRSCKIAKRLKMKIFAKEEATKLRPVASVSEDNIVWLYSKIRKVMESRFTNHLWFNQSDGENLKNWERCVDWCKLGYWSIPLDQSSFDHYVTKEMHVMALDRLKAFLVSHSNDEEVTSVMDKMIWSVSNAEYDGREAVAGYWSGLPYTMFLGSIINLAEFFVVRRVYKERTGDSINVVELAAQGDDILFVSDKDYLMDYTNLMNEMGFEVNSSKNFSSQKRNEYLRMIITKDGIKGLPLRSLKSVLWTKESVDSEDGDYLSGCLSQILQFAQRAGLSKDDTVGMCNLFTWSKFKLNLKSSLRTLSSVGGLGLYDGVESEYIYEGETVSKKYGKIYLSGAYVGNKYPEYKDQCLERLLLSTRLLTNRKIRRWTKKIAFDSHINQVVENRLPVGAYFTKTKTIMPSVLEEINFEEYGLAKLGVKDDNSLILIKKFYSSAGWDELTYLRKKLTKNLFYDLLHDRVGERKPLSLALGPLCAKKIYNNVFYEMLSNLITFSNGVVGTSMLSKCAFAAERTVRGFDNTTIFLV